MAAISASRLSVLGQFAPRSNLALARLGVVVALFALTAFGAARYDNFLSAANVIPFLS